MVSLVLLGQPSNLVGLYKEFISSPRIDNQLSTWGAFEAAVFLSLCKASGGVFACRLKWLDGKV